MKDRRHRFDPTTPRAAGRLGAAFILGLAVVLAALCLVIDTPGVDVDAGLVAAGSAALLALVAWFLPWARLPGAAQLVLAALVTVGLVGLDRLTDLSRAPQSVAFYPTAWFVVLAWIGITQARGTTAVAALFVGTSAVAVTLPDSSVIPVAAAAVGVPAAALVGETMAWALAGIRMGQRIERRPEGESLAPTEDQPG